MAFTPLASPFAELAASSWDVLVVGSGYGAATVAARLAQAKLRVAVLERGREHGPGDFPSSGGGLIESSQYDVGPLSGGPRLGLYDFRVGADVDTVVGCGLGGTSLINAGVILAPDMRVFDDPRWPRAIAEERGGRLDALFARAHATLDGRKWRPDTRDEPPKRKSLLAGATALRGWTYAAADIDVWTDAPGDNAAGVAMKSCTACGDCVSGCRFEAKSTLPTTYLALAARAGAKIFTQCEVRRVAPNGTGWDVVFERIESDGQPRADESGLARVTARRVVLGGGVLGSSSILARSRDAGLAVSDALGTRVSANGDCIAFLYDCHDPVDAVGIGGSPGTPPGPTITSLLDFRPFAADVKDGMLFEEGAIPSPLAIFARRLMPLVALYAGRGLGDGVGFSTWAHQNWDALKDLFSGGATGALDRTQVILCVAHDSASGRLAFDDAGRAHIVWPTLRDEPFLARAAEKLVAMAGALGGRYVKNPLFSPAFGNNLYTVHPLGGVPMGESAATGAVDHAGRVFAPDGRTHDGLYVADGSIVPTSLGANPLLTITALAERVAEQIVVEQRARG